MREGVLMAGRPNRGKVQPGGPANGLRRFEPNNLAALKSGAYSPRVREAYAEALTEWARAQDALSFLRDSSFAPSVWRWAQRTAASDLLYGELEAHHASKQRGSCAGCMRCRSLEARWQKADRTAERAGERLGLDPQSRAELLVKLRAAGVIKSEAQQVESLLGAIAQQFGLDQTSGELLVEEDADIVDAEEATDE
ncbi:hypothetical protein [Knoellia koreensis]|uniref:Uncharacterized protein n=1 Tax=Knoellia koreensis TaxID=2730921 RepID=A0A849HC13_9MICO|nr:hypothetical protein [Knoellia sp. DB2414S]NNM44589.1 hypothetical protein [Knoellia sp. DB2414S]